MRRVLVATVAVGVLLVTGCSRSETANQVDRDRVAAMRDDPIFADRLAPGSADEGWLSHGSFAIDSTYRAVLPAWPGENAPELPTVEQKRTAVAAAVGRLRDAGWTIVSARCRPPDEWTVFGYRVRGGVAYTVELTGRQVAGIGGDYVFGLEVTMSAPFHTDPTVYFGASPAALTASCVDTGVTGSQGTIWSRREAT